VPGDAAAIRTALLRRRDTLVRTARDEAADISDQLDRPRPLESEEASQVSEELYTLGMLSDTQRREVEQIDAALPALEAGRCAECGTEIDDARLAALPHATLCAGHAAARETGYNRAPRAVKL
jgi:RNA polymerase-binding transcription factor DksA